jgi:hypothetical protein
MAFDANRPDRERLARLPFGDAWLALVDPADLVGCDVMDVRVRMGMYRHLVERLNGSGVYGAHDQLSPFWGYASQLAWQQRSARLGAGAHAIAEGSWWGACNYALSVIPYAAAMERGLVPALRFTPDRAYAAVMPAWREAFAVMLNERADHDRVRVAIWRAHLMSITLAVANHRAAFLVMPEPEQRFARGWVRMVELFAAAAVRTDLEQLVESGGGALPPRVLHESVAVDELPRGERGTIRRIGTLADRSRWRWAIEIHVWRRIMRTSYARAEAENILAGMYGRGNQVWPLRARALAYATLPMRVVERLAVT